MGIENYMVKMPEVTGPTPYHYRDLGTLSRIFDFIQRPKYAIVNALEEAIEPEKRTAAEIVAPLWKPRLPEEVKGTGYGLLERTELPPLAKRLGGLALDIGLDPSTYVGFGALTRAGKAALKGGEVLSQMGKAKQAARGYRAAMTFAGQPIIKGERAFAAGEALAGKMEPILKQFRHGSAYKPIQEALKAANRFSRKEEAVRIPTMRAFGHAVEEGAKAGRTDLGKFKTLLTESIETPGGIGDLRTAAKSHEAYWLDLEKKVGMGTSTLDDDIEYIMAQTTGKGGRALGKALRGAETGFGLTSKEKALLEGYGIPLEAVQSGDRWIAKMAPAHTSMFARRIRGLTTMDKNAISQKLGFGKMWVDDPVALNAQRWSMAITAGRKATYLDQLADKLVAAKLAFHDPIAAEKMGVGPEIMKWIRPGSALHEKLKDLAFTPTIRDEVLRVYNTFVSRKAQGEFLRFYSKAMGQIKWWTLMPFLPTQLRNNFSNDAWFYTLAHGYDYRPYKWMGTVTDELIRRGHYGSEAIGHLTGQASWARGLGRIMEAVAPKNLPMSMDQAIQELTEYGIIGTGFTRGEVGWLPEAVGGKVGAMQGKVQTVANVIEDMGRGACYLAGRAKGWTPEEAAAETFKMFYNYGSDFGGPADRAMSQVVFFWRWVRQNLVGSGRNFAEHYGKHTALAKGIKAIEDRAGLGGEEYQPEWMKQRGAIKLRRGKRGIEMFTLQNWLPFADIAQIPRLHKYAGESLIPPLRILGEIMTGREWYYDRPIVDPSGIPGQWAGMSMNPRLAYALRQFRPISEPGRIVGQALREPPGKGRIGRALWTGFVGAKTYPYRPEKEAGSRFFETIPKIATVTSQMKRIERETPDQQRKHRKLYQNLGKLLEKLREEEARYAAGAGIR